MALEKFQHGETDYPSRHVSWHNNRVREEMADFMLEEARRLDIPAIISMIGYIGQWDEQIQALQEQGYLTGENTSYDQDLT